MNDALENKMGELTSQIKTMAENGASKAEVSKLHDDLKRQGEILTELTEQQKSAFVKGYSEQLKDWLKDKQADLRELYNKGAGSLTFTPDMDQVNKVVGDIFRANGTIGTVPAYNDVSMSNVRLRSDQVLLNFCSITSTSQASHPYTEVAAGEGDVAYTAEGGTKPQLDFDWVTNYATPYKPAGYEVLTEEVVDDIPRIQSVATTYLKDKHDLKKVDQIYFGDGTGANPQGATGAASAFSNARVPDNTFPLDSSTIVDQINALLLDISLDHNFTDEIPYRANVVMMNPIDFWTNFVAKKDNNGLPMYPQATLFGEVNLGGVRVVQWEKMPAGNIFVADMSKYNVANYKPYSVRIGWINDQLITNKFTIVGESRHHAYIKSQDLKAFRYDTIANVKAGIEAIS